MKPYLVQQAEQTSCTLQDLVGYFQHQGILGQEDIAILTTFGLAHRLKFGIEGKSGTGKTHLATIALSLFPAEYVHCMGLSSETAESYNAEAMNRAYLLYIPELQKALGRNSINLEIVKSLSEGKPSIRKVQRGHTTLEFKIEADKGILYTLATENAYKPDMELFRRMFQLYTDDSMELTKQVVEKKLEQAAGIGSETAMHDADAFQAHCVRAMLLPFHFINPFAHALQEYLPSEHVLMRSYINHYLALMEASARFQYPGRVQEKDAKGRKLYLSLADVKIIHDLWLLHCKQSLERVGWQGAFPAVDWEKVQQEGVAVMQKQHSHVAEAWTEREKGV
ncbi:hypothetical protein HYS48_02035 [Candidatus Woesearchaeota archaeon]|nr:hypothetical protein [Candidatus Woesearchaeota archaeon]